MAFALKVALVIHTDLAAGIWVLAFINVCGKDQKSELAGGSACAWVDRGELTTTSLLIHEPETCWTCALEADLEVSADVRTAAIVVQTLVQPWEGTLAAELLGQAGKRPRAEQSLGAADTRNQETRKPH